MAAVDRPASPGAQQSVQQLLESATPEGWGFSVDACPWGTMLVDDQGIVLYVNPATCALADTDRDQLEGRALRTISPTLAALARARHCDPQPTRVALRQGDSVRPMVASWFPAQSTAKVPQDSGWLLLHTLPGPGTPAVID